MRPTIFSLGVAVFMAASTAFIFWWFFTGQNVGLDDSVPVRCVYVVQAPESPVFITPPPGWPPPPGTFGEMWLCAGEDVPFKYYSEPQGEVMNAPTEGNDA